MLYNTQTSFERGAKGKKMRGVAVWTVLGLPAIDTILLAYFLASQWMAAVWPRGQLGLAICLLAIPLTQRLLREMGIYDSHRVEHPLSVARDVAIAYAGSALIASTSLWMISPVAGRAMAMAFIKAGLLVILLKCGIFASLRVARRRGLDQRSVLLVGSWDQAQRFDGYLKQRPEWGLQLRFVQPGGIPAHQEPVECVSFPGRQPAAGNIEELLQTHVVDEVLVPIAPDAPAFVFEEARRFAPYGLQVRVMFEPAETPRGAFARVDGEDLAGSVSVLGGTLSSRGHAIKRVIDIAGSFALLLLLAPLMAVIALAVRMSSPGPILFRQIRAGLNGRRFEMLKFRTMVDGAEFRVRHLHRSLTRGPVFKDPTDYRLTGIGRMLRRFSLDELPQLINVLRGDMSLVGPRPLPVAEASQVTGAYRRRFSVVPGLTCIWQVSGRSDVPYDRWMQYDLEYIDKQSVWFDLVLLWRTIPAVLTGRGAY